MTTGFNRKEILEEIFPSNQISNKSDSENRTNIITPIRPSELGSSIKISSIRLNNLKDRIFILSPKVKSGQDRESNLEDFYILEEPIRYGCLGNVDIAIHKVSKVKYALKIIKKEEIINKNFVEKINTFIDNNYRFTNQYLIKFINHFEEDQNLVFIYPYMKVNLLDYINNHFDYDELYENQSMQYFIQILSGMIFLHNNKKFNIDIRPKNIMIDKQNIIKITDVKNREIINTFFIKKPILKVTATPDEIANPTLDYYTSPEELEVFSKNDFFEFQYIEKSDKVDVWRIGALLYHLITGKAPYQVYDNIGILNDTSSSTLQKKADLIKDFFNEKQIRVEIFEDKGNYDESFQRIEESFKKISSHPLATDEQEKVESLVKFFMEKNLRLRPNMKDLKENQEFKSLFSKHNISRESIDYRESQRMSLQKSGSPLSLLKSPESPEMLKKLASPKKLISSESIEYEGLPLEAKIKILEEENAKYKKENERFKFDNIRLLNENKLLQNKIMDIKFSFDKDRKNIEEEKNRMKTINQDRILKLNELDELTNEVIDLKSKVRLLENDKDMLNFDLKDANDNIEELKKNLEETKITLENERNEFNIKLENLSKHLKRYQKIYLGEQKDSTEFFKDEENIKRFAITLYDLVKEFKITLDSYILQNLTDKEDILYNIDQMLSDKEEAIKNYIQKIKDDFLNDFIRVSVKSITGHRDHKHKERLGWFQKQVAELTPFKIKSVNLEIQNYKLTTENKIQLEALNIKNTEIDLLKKFNQGLNENIKIHTEYINLLESKIEIIKSSIFKYLPNCFENMKN